MKLHDSAPGRLTLLERKRVLDVMALVAVAAMFLAVAIPWFFQIVETEISSAARSAFALAAVYLIVAMVVDRWGNRRALAVAMNVSPFAAVIMAAVVWHFSGGVRYPVALVVLCIPVLAAALLGSGRIVFGVAAAAVIAVAFTVMIEAPAVGWYLSRVGLPVGSLMRRLTPSSDAMLLELAPSELAAILAGFAVAMIALAAAVTVSLNFLRADLVRSSGVLSAQGEVLLEHAWRASPLPMALITEETAQLVDASDSFFHQMLMRMGSGRGSELFDLIQFDDRQAIQKLLSAGGDLQFVRYRIGNESRVAAVHAEKFIQHEAGYVCVTIRDWNEVAYMALAADTFDRPLILVGKEDHRLRYANRAAGDALGPMYFGRDMRWLTDSAGGPAGFEVTQMPLQLAGSEPAVLFALTPREVS